MSRSSQRLGQQGSELGRPIPTPGPGRKRRRLESPVRNNFRGSLLPLNLPALKGFITHPQGLPGRSFPTQPQHGALPSQHSQPQ